LPQRGKLSVIGNVRLAMNIHEMKLLASSKSCVSDTDERSLLGRTDSCSLFDLGGYWITHDAAFTNLYERRLAYVSSDKFGEKSAAAEKMRR